MNYYEHHIGDFVKDAGYLSMAEEGAYRRLIDAYYTKEKPLPVEIKECCKIARATSKLEREAVRYVVEEFFILEADGYHQKRCDEEIARFKDKQEKAKRSANARWADKQSQSEGNATASPNADADGMRTHSEGNATRARPQSPVTSNQTQTPPSGSVGNDDGNTPNQGAIVVADWLISDEIILGLEIDHGIPVEFSLAVLDEFRDFWAGKALLLPTEWQSRFRQRVRDQHQRTNLRSVS